MRQSARLIRAMGLLTLLAVASCSKDAYSPTDPTAGAPPTPPVSTTVSFAGNIMDADTFRACIDHAQAEIIAGPASGTVYPQNRDYCEDPGAGFVINGLTVGDVLRLRVSAPGYTTVERDFAIVRPSPSIDINLKRTG